MSGQVVKLITVTPNGEELMAYCARVSSPKQDNPEYAGLLKYCMQHGHWSVFEQADMTVEITTSRAIAQQILRHRSFCFQEFSQRYSKVKSTYLPYEARSQDLKNRQNSNNDMCLSDKNWFIFAQQRVYQEARRVYEEALQRGIAKECARAVLPANTSTKLYMKGNVRSWIHYLNTRLHESTQKEHREVAEQVLDIFMEEFPVVSQLLKVLDTKTDTE